MDIRHRIFMHQVLERGSLLYHGKFRIERVLGQGGFGITYLVTDLGLDKLRAIKEFFPEDYCERGENTSRVLLRNSNKIEYVNRLKEKFIKEARRLANLDQHNGIVKIQTVFEENNTAYYVMDYIEGESLFSIVRNSGPIPVDRALRYIKGVGEALSYIHSHNINHLDIKPANIVIRRKDDKPILIDFGLAKHYDSKGRQTSNTPTGISHGFAPFEQYDPGGVKEFSPQTDVYSLAATLYYLISGEIPPHATDLVENVLTFPPSFPLNLQAPILSAMSTKRLERPETVDRFLDSLNDATKTKNRLIRLIPLVLVVGALVCLGVEFIGPSPTYIDKTPPIPPGDKGKDTTKVTKVETTPKPGDKGEDTTKVTKVETPPKPVVKVDASKVPQEENPPKIEGKDAPIVPMDDTKPKPPPEKNDHLRENLAVKTTLGLCSYTGKVDENNRPHGLGVATWESGEAKSYNGEWVHGNMDGKTIYIHRSGDTFVGIFKNNRYYSGIYTIKDTGAYFVGTFKNGQPDQGKWYYKDGSVFQ